MDWTLYVFPRLEAQPDVGGNLPRVSWTVDSSQTFRLCGEVTVAEQEDEVITDRLFQLTGGRSMSAAVILNQSTSPVTGISLPCR